MPAGFDEGNDAVAAVTGVADGPITGTLVAAEAIRTRIVELGADITRDYAGRTPLLDLRAQGRRDLHE